LDTIGIAGFSHDFGSLDGKHSIVAQVFDAFGNNPSASAFNKIVILLAQVFPIMVKTPTKRKGLTDKLNTTMSEISNDLLIRSRREKDMDVSDTEAGKSIIGLLSTISNAIMRLWVLIDTIMTMTVKAEDQDAELHLSGEEVLAQVRG